MRKFIENYAKPTPKKWRRLGDFAIVAIPVIEAQLALYPMEIHPVLKWGITTILILFKLYTNTKVEANLYEGKV